MSAEKNAQAELRKLGFPRVVFAGREPYRGKERLLFTLPDGEPVMDAPIIVVTSGDQVELRPWTDQFE